MAQPHPFLTRLSGATAIVAASAVILLGQTRVTPPDNKYSLAQDVEMGREAAQQARQELPLMSDDAVTSYVDDLGKRLVSGIPPALKHAEFAYTFETVNVRDINAFALPGGPMFVNRGMIEAAASEGEVAGVMAHEISHVVLRHGTAQASKAGKYQAGAVAGAIFGAIVGGRVGDFIAQGTQFGLGAAFLRFSRDYERQADLQGAQIMARVGYDPREMASMFRTIEKEGGANGPEWLSSHPNPGNRSEYITKEAQSLRVAAGAEEADSRRFGRVKAHLASLPKAPTTEEASKARKTGTSTTGDGRPSAPPSGSVAAPSPRFRDFTAGNVFRVSVPSNWRAVEGSSAVTYAPDGAFGSVRGQSVFTHGVELGIAGYEGRDLRSASEALVDSLSRGNPNMRTTGRFLRTRLGNQDGLVITLDNVSDVTRQNETVEVRTTQLRDGRLFYAIAVVPENQASAYAPTFDRVLSSIRLLR